MKKLITILTPLFLLLTVSAKAEIGMGITGAYHMIDGDGTETARDSGELNTGSHSKDVTVPEVFLEAIADSGFTLGFSYIPTRELGSKARTDSNSAGDSGTYTAKAELDNVAMLYVDMPVYSGIIPVHVKLGVQHLTVKTLESLNSGSAYPDIDVYGTTIGLGTKGDIPFGNNLYYKAEVTYTDFEDIAAESDAQNRISVDLDDTAVKLSVGMKF